MSSEKLRRGEDEDSYTLASLKQSECSTAGSWTVEVWLDKQGRVKDKKESTDRRTMLILDGHEGELKRRDLEDVLEGDRQGRVGIFFFLKKE